MVVVVVEIDKERDARFDGSRARWGVVRKRRWSNGTGFAMLAWRTVWVPFLLLLPLAGAAATDPLLLPSNGSGSVLSLLFSKHRPSHTVPSQWAAREVRRQLPQVVNGRGGGGEGEDQLTSHLPLLLEALPMSTQRS